MVDGRWIWPQYNVTFATPVTRKRLMGWSYCICIGPQKEGEGYCVLTITMMVVDAGRVKAERDRWERMTLD